MTTDPARNTLSHSPDPRFASSSGSRAEYRDPERDGFVVQGKRCEYVIADLIAIERQCVVEDPVGAVPLRARESDLGASPVAAPQLSFTAVERQDRFPLKRDRDKGKPGESRGRKATRLRRTA